jgi:flagellar motor switch protein FliN/FliY
MDTSSFPPIDLTRTPGHAPTRSRELAAIEAVELPVAVELGQVRIRVEDLLRIDGDSVVELDRRPSDPVDIRVGGVVVARGELVAVDTPAGSRIGVRLVEILERPATPPR